MTNINAIHQHLQNTFPKKMIMPEFWCEDSPNNDGSLLLFYFSHRGAFLAPVAMGLVTEIAKYQFELDVTMALLTTQGVDGSRFTSWIVATKDPKDMYKLTTKVGGRDGIANAPTNLPPSVAKCPMSGMEINFDEVPGYVVTTSPPPSVALTTEYDSEEFMNHGTVQVPLNDDGAGCPYHQATLASSHHNRMSSAPSMVVSWNDDLGTRRPRSAGGGTTIRTQATVKRGGLSAAATRTIFPYHVLIDADFCILQVGNDLPKVLGTTKSILFNSEIDDVFEFVKPKPAKWTRSWLQKLRDQEFVLECTLSSCPANVVFKGTWLPSHGKDIMLILCPDAKNLEELREMNLTLSDLPAHGAYRDAVFLREHLSHQMNNALAMEKLSKKLQTEKNLLESLLPSHAAQGLREGKSVQPMMHNAVTMFFSDIVGFTNICKQISPTEVIDMLNCLYSIMDFLAAKFNLFKVETIGDAYVCCGGLPRADENHAQNIANFAIAVQHCCRRVLSPLDQQPIQLRVGINSGECASGIVGVTNPRYCVFGDTVNTTARHESTGLAGKVHCSHSTMLHLRSKNAGKDFVIASRGLVDMKGKGKVATYWIDSSEQNTLTCPSALKELEMEVGRRYAGQQVPAPPSSFSSSTDEKKLSPKISSSSSDHTSSTESLSVDSASTSASSSKEVCTMKEDFNLRMRITPPSLTTTSFNQKAKSAAVPRATKQSFISPEDINKTMVTVTKLSSIPPLVAPASPGTNSVKTQGSTREEIIEKMHRRRRERVAKALESTSKLLRQ
jgi:class 3 adenylate cyclase